MAAGGGQTRQRRRSGVARMALGAAADGAVGVGAPDAMALFASAGHGARAFELNKGMRRPSRTTRLIPLRERHLFRRQSLLAVNGGPGRCRVTAAKKFLVDLLVTAPAVSRREVLRDHEP